VRGAIVGIDVSLNGHAACSEPEPEAIAESKSHSPGPVADPDAGGEERHLPAGASAWTMSDPIAPACLQTALRDITATAHLCWKACIFGDANVKVSGKTPNAA
jgi:hypothetical protein